MAYKQTAVKLASRRFSYARERVDSTARCARRLPVLGGDALRVFVVAFALPYPRRLGVSHAPGRK